MLEKHRIESGSWVWSKRIGPVPVMLVEIIAIGENLCRVRSIDERYWFRGVDELFNTEADAEYYSRPSRFLT